MKYPCNYCGSCGIWLAAFEKETGLETKEQVIKACMKRKCPLVEKEVIPDDIHEAYWLHRAQHNDYIWVECSKCGFRVENYKAVVLDYCDTLFKNIKYYYCPICGCKMRV